jgi:uncharacterized protein (DUF433 family)
VVGVAERSIIGPVYGPKEIGMSKHYVRKVGTAYRLVGSRVSLDSVVYAFLDGQSPESIVESFPTLSLEQVYGAITFYLAHRDEIDDYLRQGEEGHEALRQSVRQADPAFYKRLEEARNRMASAKR